MAEPILIELNKDTDFDGVSPIALTRDDFTVSGQRYYKASVSGPGRPRRQRRSSACSSDASPKLVGFAGSSFNPQSIARVLASDPLNSIREEIQLTPYVQHVLVFPGDRIALLTQEGGRAQVVLIVNELNEGDNVQYALGHETFAQVRRLRFIRETGVPFAPNPTGVPWAPNFVFNPLSGLLVTNENTTGPIPTSQLSLYPRHQGVYLTVRYAGNGAVGGKLHLIDAETREAREVESGLTTGAVVEGAVRQPRRHDRPRGGSGCRGCPAGRRHRDRPRVPRRSSPRSIRGGPLAMPLLDRHRLVTLMGLTTLERTVTGPERLLREPDVALLIKAAYDDASDPARATFMARVQAMPTSAWPWSAVQAMPARRSTCGLAAAAAASATSACRSRPPRRRCCCSCAARSTAPTPTRATSSRTATPRGGRVGAPAGRARPLGHGDDPPVHSAAGLGAAEHHPQGGSGRGGHERRPGAGGGAPAPTPGVPATQTTAPLWKLARRSSRHGRRRRRGRHRRHRLRARRAAARRQAPRGSSINAAQAAGGDEAMNWQHLDHAHHRDRRHRRSLASGALPVRPARERCVGHA
jgi:hypothetical protein